VTGWQILAALRHPLLSGGMSNPLDSGDLYGVVILSGGCLDLLGRTGIQTPARVMPTTSCLTKVLNFKTNLSKTSVINVTFKL
jgi:hypothetical protein